MEASPSNYESARISARKIYRICPKCKGKGYFEDVQMPRRNLFSASAQNNIDGIHPEERSNKNCSKSETQCIRNDKSMSAINMNTKLSPTISLIASPTSAKAGGCRSKEQGINGYKKNILPDKFKLEKRWSYDIPHSLTPPRSGTRSTITKIKSFGSDTSINSDLSDLLRTDRDLGDPKEAMKKARKQIKSNNWVAIMSGLEDIAILCAQTQEDSTDQCDQASLRSRLIDWDTVGLAMTRLVASFHLQKTRSVRLTCQILRELFRLMSTAVHRPQFDDAVNELMKRTADTSRMIRWDAQQALDSMIIHVPVQFSTRAILNQAPKHKNPVVRQTAMRLIENIVTMITSKVLLTHYQLKEPRKQIVNTLCALIDDQNQSVRWLVRQTIQNLMSSEQFEEILNLDVEPHVLKKADRSLILLQYSPDIEISRSSVVSPTI